MAASIDGCQTASRVTQFGKTAGNRVERPRETLTSLSKTPRPGDCVRSRAGAKYVSRRGEVEKSRDSRFACTSRPAVARVARDFECD